MAGSNFTRKYTVELDLDVKKAPDQLKKLTSNIRTITSDLDKASDKFSVFKDLIDYLSQIDEKIASFKTSAPDLFNNIFGLNGQNIDSAIKNGMQSIMQSPEKITDVLNQVQSKISELYKRKEAGQSVKMPELREIAEQLKELYALAGKEPPNSLETFFAKGTRASLDKISTLKDALNGFSVEWDKALEKVSSGFSAGSGSGGVGGFDSEVQAKIDKLKKEIEELKALKSELNSILSDINNFDNTEPINLEVDMSKESLQKLIDKYRELEAESKNLEKGTNDYYTNLAQRTKTMLQLYKAQNEGGLEDSISIEISKMTDLFEDVFNEFKSNLKNMSSLIDQEIAGIEQKIDSIVSKAGQSEGNGVGGQLLKTYEQLLEIIDKVNILIEEPDFNDESIQLLVKNLKDLYATSEQFGQVDNIFKNMLDASITDSDALEQLKNLFGIEIPDSVKTASQKLDEFYGKIDSQKKIGFDDELSAGKYLSDMETLMNELQSLREQGRLTTRDFEQAQKVFDEDVKGYVETFKAKNNILKELDSLNKKAIKATEKSELEDIIQKRRELIRLAEQNGSLSAKQLQEEKAITDEIEKRINVQKQEKKSEENTEKSGSGSKGEHGAGVTAKEDTGIQNEIKAQGESTRETITASIKSIIGTIEQLKTDLTAKLNDDNDESAIQAMKSSLMDMVQQIQAHNSVDIKGKPTRQELASSLFSNGQFILSNGESGRVKFNTFAETLLANLQQQLLVSLHSHPLRIDSNGIKYSNDMFSGSDGDIGAFANFKNLGAKAVGISTGDVLKIIDISKVTQEQMLALSKSLAQIEPIYSKKYSQYFAENGAYKSQSSLEGYQEVGRLIDEMLLKAMKSAKIPTDVLQSYDTKDDKQMTALATRLVELSKSADQAVSPVERLTEIIKSIGGDVQSDFAKSQLLGFTKGDLSASEVYNNLVDTNTWGKVSQHVVDQLISSVKSSQIPSSDQNISQIIALMNSIQSILSNIEAGINENKNVDAIKYSKALSGFDSISSIAQYRAKEGLYDVNDVSRFKNESVIQSAIKAYHTFDDILESNVTTSKQAGQALSAFFEALEKVNQATQQLNLYKEAYGEYDADEKTKIGLSRMQDMVGSYFKNLSSSEMLERIRSYADMAVGTSSTSSNVPVSESVDQSALSTIQSSVQRTEEIVTSVQADVKAQNANITTLATAQSQTGTAISQLLVTKSEVSNSTNGPWALENTLGVTNGILGEIRDVLSNGGSFTRFTADLQSIVTELKNVAAGTQQQATYKTTTSIASARISDNAESEKIRSIAFGAIDDKAVEKEITSMRALKDGVVQVTGTLKNAEGVWESFSMRITQAGEVENLTITANQKLTNQMKQFSSDMSQAGDDVSKYESKLSQLKSVPDDISQRLQGLKDKLSTVTNGQELEAWRKEWSLLTSDIDGIEKKQLEESTAFKKGLTAASSVIDTYEKKMADLKTVSQDVSDKFTKLKDDLGNITTPEQLNAWIERLSQITPVIDEIIAKEQEAQKLTLNGILNSANNNYKTLGIDPLADKVPTHLEDVDKKYKQLRYTIEQATKSGTILSEQQISELKALAREIEAAAKQYGNLGEKKKAAYGTDRITNAMAKHSNMTQTIASNPELAQSSVIQQLLATYEEAYSKLIAKQKEFENSTTQPTKEQIVEFKALTQQFNEASSALDKVVNSSKKLQQSSTGRSYSLLGSQYDLSKEADRMEALKAAVDDMTNGKAKVGNFSKDLTQLYYTVDNGNGTFTRMTATLNAAKTAIYETAGETEKTTTKFARFFNDIKGKVKSLSAYLISMGSLYKVINQVKQGVQYVREIDTALTELKKVTDETDATYSKFLQTMSKSAGVVGSTVKDLTNSAAD